MPPDADRVKLPSAVTEKPRRIKKAVKRTRRAMKASEKAVALVTDPVGFLLGKYEG